MDLGHNLKPPLGFQIISLDQGEVCTFKMKIYLKRCTFNLQMTAIEIKLEKSNLNGLEF